MFKESLYIRMRRAYDDILIPAGVGVTLALLIFAWVCCIEDIELPADMIAVASKADWGRAVTAGAWASFFGLCIIPGVALFFVRLVDFFRR